MINCCCKHYVRTNYASTALGGPGFLLGPRKNSVNGEHAAGKGETEGKLPRDPYMREHIDRFAVVTGNYQRFMTDRNEKNALVPLV